MAEQVDGDDMEALTGEVTSQWLLHPSRHQLPMDQHHPAVTGAVLGVLESVTTGLALEEELANAFGDEHVHEVTQQKGANG